MYSTQIHLWMTSCVIGNEVKQWTKQKSYFPRIYNQDHFEMENLGKWWRQQKQNDPARRNSFEIYCGLDPFATMWKKLYLNSLYQCFAKLSHSGMLKKW